MDIHDFSVSTVAADRMIGTLERIASGRHMDGTFTSQRDRDAARALVRFICGGPYVLSQREYRNRAGRVLSMLTTV